jgi:hypothetical protein
MKKTILILALALISVSAFAQSKADTVNKSARQPVSRAAFKADPNRVYTVKYTAEAFSYLMITAKFGFEPYLKTTNIEFKYVDKAKAAYEAIYDNAIKQFNMQISADSAKWAADTLITKNKK